METWLVDTTSYICTTDPTLQAEVGAEGLGAVERTQAWTFALGTPDKHIALSLPGLARLHYSPLIAFPAKGSH